MLVLQHSKVERKLNANSLQLEGERLTREAVWCSCLCLGTVLCILPSMTSAGRPSDAAAPAGPDGASHENRVLRELVTVYHHLTGLALQNADIQSVASLLAERTASQVAVVSPTLEVLTAAAPGRGPDGAAEATREQIAAHRLGRLLVAVAQARRAMRLPGTNGAAPVVVAPIVVGGDILAYLLTVEGPRAEAGEDLGLLMTEHAATICGVIMGRERVIATAAGRVRDDLVEGLLLGRASDPGDMKRWAHHLGYDPAHTHRVLLVALEDAGAGVGAEAAAHGRRLFDGLAHLVATRAPDAIVAARDREMVIVAREHGPVQEPGRVSPAQLGAACLVHAGQLFPDARLSVGIGGPCREPVEVAGAYAQARRTIGTLRRMGRQGEVVAFEDLGIHRLLLLVPDIEDLRSFADEVLGSLRRHDREHRSVYLRTLATYLRENGSLQRAARRLHVHPNTVTYRLSRVEEITGLDLDVYQDRLMAQVALEILDAVGGG